MTHPNLPESRSSSRITRPYLTSVKFFTRNNQYSIQQNAYIKSSAKRQLWPSVVHLTYAIYWFAPSFKTPENNTLRHPPGTFRCNSRHGCLTCPNIDAGRTTYTFSTTGETRKIKQHITYKSNNLTYMIECKKCKKQYIGETKRSLRERFTEHRQATNNSDHASASAAVPTHSACLRTPSRTCYLSL